MKLKKAMRLYPIEVVLPGEATIIYKEYRLNKKRLWFDETNRCWYGAPLSFKFETEKQSVAWLIKDAECKPKSIKGLRRLVSFSIHVNMTLDKAGNISGIICNVSDMKQEWPIR